MVRNKSRRSTSQLGERSLAGSDSTKREEPLLPKSEFKTPTEVVTTGVIRHEIRHFPSNTDLRVDENGVRWPERVVLNGEAEELLKWSQEYAEHRAKIYDLEKGRREKEKRFIDNDTPRMGEMRHGRNATVQVLPKKMSRVLPLDSGLMNVEEASNVKFLKGILPAQTSNTGLERSDLFM